MPSVGVPAPPGGVANAGGVAMPGGVAPGDLPSFPGSSDEPPDMPIPLPGVPVPGMPCRGGTPGGGLPPKPGPKPGAFPENPFGGGGAPTGRPAPSAVLRNGMLPLMALPVPVPSGGKKPGRGGGGGARFDGEMSGGGGPKLISLGGGGGRCGAGFLGGTDGTAGFFLSFLTRSCSLPVCFLIRLLLKSPPCSRRRISNFRNSTIVITAERINSKTTNTSETPMMVE